MGCIRDLSGILGRSLKRLRLAQRFTMTGFSEKVFQIVSRIQSGETLTYKEVAKIAGNPNACRAVGNVLNKNYNPKIPCHRVVRSDGSIGGYNRGWRKKAKLLRLENKLKKEKLR